MVRGVMIGIVSVALFTLTVSCLLTKDFPAPGTLTPQVLFDLIVPSEEQGGTTQEATIVTLPSGEEVLYLQGFKEVWFNLTELVSPLQPNERVQISTEVKSTAEATLFFLVKFEESGQLVKEEKKEIGTDWIPASVSIDIPSTLPSTPTFLFGIKSEGVDFYIRRLQVSKTPSSAEEAQ